MPRKLLLLIPLLLPLPVLAQTSPTLLDLQLIAIEARANVASHSPESIAEFAEAERAAQTGDVEAQLALAITWLKAAANEQHFVPAYNALGEHLMRAAVDELDRGEAFHWYDRSAREKQPPGMRNLARAHELGLGVKQSDQLALIWYERAGWRGDVPAIRRMLDVYAKGELGQAANAEDAAEWRGKLMEAENK